MAMNVLIDRWCLLVLYTPRMVMGTWILACFIITAGYGGTLRAFLTQPSYSKPIDNFQEVLDLGIPFDYAPIGEEIEEVWANSKDPFIRRLWDNMIFIPYEQYITERVMQVKIVRFSSDYLFPSHYLQ